MNSPNLSYMRRGCLIGKQKKEEIVGSYAHFYNKTNLVKNLQHMMRINFFNLVIIVE